MKRSRQPASFRRELTVTVWVGIVLAVLGTTGGSLVMMRLLLERQFRGQALAEAAVAGRESLYPLLGASPSEAHRLMENMLHWPDVTFAALDDAVSGRRLAEAGQPAVAISTVTVRDPAELVSPWISSESADSWHVIVPIAAKESGLPFGESEQRDRERPPAPMGYLHLVFGKKPLHQLTWQVSVVCSVGGVLVAALILLWIARRIRTVTIPLRSLATVMENQDTAGVRADVVGATEVRQIALAFNRLMARVDENTESLERKVTERTRDFQRASEAAQQAERSKSALLAASTHEMKMPLHLIHLHVRRALQELEFVGAGAERTRDSLAAILQAAGELLARIVKILDAARAAGARHDVINEPFAVSAFLEVVRERAEPLARAQRDELVIQSSGSPIVHGDREKLFDIIAELLMNACKFTQDGTVQLVFDVQPSECRIEISDNGCGIPESEQELVWQEFRQGSGGANPTYPGQGLGLSMVRRLVQLLGGVVTLTSALNHGTRITVTIPIEAHAVQTRMLHTETMA